MKVSTYLVDLYIQKICLTGLRILTYWWYLCWLLLKPGDTFPNPEPSLVQLQNFRFSIFKTSQTCISNCLQGNSSLCMFSMLTPLVSVHRLFMVVWLTLRGFPLLFVKNGNYVFSRIQLFYTKRFYKRTSPYY